MDFITGQRFMERIASMVIEMLTKFTHFYAISTYYSTSKVAYLFFREVFRLHELPKYIVSDWDKIFLSEFW